MKFKLLLLICLILPFITFAQQPVTAADSARKLVDSALSYARQNSIYRNKVDWKVLIDSVNKRTENVANIMAAMPGIALMYKMLGDFHGGAYYQGKTYKWNTVRSKADPVKYKELVAKFRRAKPAIETRILEKGYGYLLIPGNNPTKKGETEAITQQIQDSLTKLIPATLKGVVIDLRTNTGGSMYPMILGIGNLLNKGKLGAFVYPGGKHAEAWYISGHSMFADTEKMDTITAFCKVNPKIKIAVLTSPYTASSAEATAISFKGQKNARVFGDITGGYTTANESFSYFGVEFLMAIAVEADRNGVVYYENVLPDQEVVAGDNFNDFSKDEKIIAAMKWLKGK
jgi:carboxyl-terminal processing protease